MNEPQKETLKGRDRYTPEIDRSTPARSDLGYGPGDVAPGLQEVEITPEKAPTTSKGPGVYIPEILDDMGEEDREDAERQRKIDEIIKNRDNSPRTLH